MVSGDSTQHATLEALARLCQSGRAHAAEVPRGQPTGYAALDASLPQGGWPLGALTELLLDVRGQASDQRISHSESKVFAGHGIGELRLLMPALAQLTQADRYVAFIEPPYPVFPPALAQQGVRLERVLLIRLDSSQQQAGLQLWSMEQALRCSLFGAVLAWPQAVSDKALRRLQLAAEAGRNLAMLYRPLAAAQLPSPAALRLSLQATAAGLQVEIRKCRGGRAGAKVNCFTGVDQGSLASLPVDPFASYPRRS